jgi:hypothetical protein
VADSGDTLPPQQQVDDSKRDREQEGNEREERRGLEARAGALLAAGAAVVGLVATAVGNLNLRGPERDNLLDLVVAGSAVMLVALVMVARALSLGMTSLGPGEQLPAYVERICRNNQKMVWWLRLATWVFASSVAIFLAVVIWAAYASAPPPKTTMTVVVRGERGPAGPHGNRGPWGFSRTWRHMRLWDPPPR